MAMTYSELINEIRKKDAFIKKLQNDLASKDERIKDLEKTLDEIVKEINPKSNLPECKEEAALKDLPEEKKETVIVKVNGKEVKGEEAEKALKDMEKQIEEFSKRREEMLKGFEESRKLFEEKFFW